MIRDNVCSVKKDTKLSIVLLLHLVSFFTERTLLINSTEVEKKNVYRFEKLDHEIGPYFAFFWIERTKTSTIF